MVTYRAPTMSETTVNLADAKARLSELTERVSEEKQWSSPDVGSR